MVKNCRFKVFHVWEYSEYHENKKMSESGSRGFSALSYRYVSEFD